MDSLAIILSVVLIMGAVSFHLLSTRNINDILKRHMKFNQPYQEFIISTKGREVKDNNPSSFPAQLAEVKKYKTEEISSTDIEEKMRYYMNAEKYRSAGTLHQLKKLEKEWA